MHQRHRLRRAGVVVACALALALTACSAVEPVVVDVPPQTDADFPVELSDQLQASVAHAMAATGSPGAIVGVWAPWSGQYVTAFGTSEPAGAGSEVSADQPFKIAQVTRAMTCDVLYALTAEGTVALDDSVTAYVSGVADLEDVKLSHLCDGTSGIGSYSGQLLPTWLAHPTRIWNPSELASYGLGVGRTEPGGPYRDSDAAYVLLGLALERAAGKPMTQLIEEHIAAPLNLTTTTLPDDSAEVPDDLLRGYLSQRDAAGAMNCAAPLDITALSTSTGFTDSGVESDIHDLGRYAQALAAGALLPESVDRLANPLPAYEGAPAWHTAAGGVYQAGTLVGQHGAVPGYATAAYSDPATGLTVAVVLNNSAAGAGPAVSLAWELAALASKAPAAAGETAPEAGLPWTAQQYHDAITAAAVCPIA